MGHKQLNREKREIIERLLGQRYSLRSIARILGYSPSAICQEVMRNREYINGKLEYRHRTAQRKTNYRRKRFGKTYKSDDVVMYVVEKLKQYWSPEQIAGRLKPKFPNQPERWISFKTIYRWIERSKRYRSPLGLKMKYTKYLRLKRPGKQMRPDGKDTRGRRRHLPSIEDRPEEACGRTTFGHWEGDLVLGYKGKDNVATLVEMSTGYCWPLTVKTNKRRWLQNQFSPLFVGWMIAV